MCGLLNPWMKCRIVDMEEPHMWLYADLYVQILTVWRVSTPNLLVFQG